MNRALQAALLASLCAGCATQGTSSYTYTPNTARTVPNEKTVGRPQAIVWDELVRELSKSFFVINNIERESRIINVSFNSNTPLEYVDCGRTRRTFAQGEKVETFEYDVAASSTYKVATERQEHPAFSNYVLFRRETSLEGRSNIYVAPDPGDSSRTVVSVNTRYIWAVRVNGSNFAEHISGNRFARGTQPERNFSIIFSTNKPSQPSSDLDRTICFGKGKLEGDILNMVRP